MGGLFPSTFAVVTVRDGKIEGVEMLAPPAHEPGVLPQWLSEQGVDRIIAGGMGQRAQALFAEYGIEVLVGASGLAPEALVRAFMDGTLATGDNICDH